MALLARYSRYGHHTRFYTWLPGISAVLLIGSLATVVLSQGPPLNNGLTYSKLLGFRIPFETDGNERYLREVQLWMSEDQGQNWRPRGSVAPTQRGFDFQADHDGVYWFVARTVDLQNQARQTPGILKICIDTKPPVITLRPGPALIEWDIREENLDLSSFALDYRSANNSDWVPLQVEPVAYGQRFLPSDVTGPVEVRLRVRDLAKNDAEAKVIVNGAGGRDARQNYQDPARVGGRGAIGTHWVNSRRISINYKLQEMGPSGVSKVQLWMTRDTRTWDMVHEESVRPEEAAADRPLTYVYEVMDDGKYGFAIVPKSGVDISHPPPHSGDQPQIWIEVDTVKPAIDWVTVDVGRGPDKGTVTITWKATDKNLAREPITLSYAGQQGMGANWKTIQSNLENTGRYVWKFPADVPYSFYVRVEAVDLAKNVGSLVWAKQVIVDLSEPKAMIQDANPAADK